MGKFHAKTFKAPRAFPYEATNLGGKKAKHNVLAFLDTATVPAKNWIKDYLQYLDGGYDLVLGTTRYYSRTFFQNLVHWSTWGHKIYETMPGSMIYKEFYIKNNLIREGVRAGGDIEWRDRVKAKYKWFLPPKAYLKYESIPRGPLLVLKKLFFYQIHAAFSEVQKNARDAYMGFFLILSIIIIPKWNYIVGWRSSVLFIPNITKIFLISLACIFLILLFFSNTNFKRFFSNSFLGKATKASILIVTFTIILRWNAVIAGWVEESVWFVPHITKIFLIFIFSLSFIYRGIFLPLRTGIKFHEIFPLKWVCVGLFGFCADLVKMPGYVLGAIFSLFGSMIYKK